MKNLAVATGISMIVVAVVVVFQTQANLKGDVLTNDSTMPNPFDYSSSFTDPTLPNPIQPPPWLPNPELPPPPPSSPPAQPKACCTAVTKFCVEMTDETSCGGGTVHDSMAACDSACVPSSTPPSCVCTTPGGDNPYCTKPDMVSACDDPDFNCAAECGLPTHLPTGPAGPGDYCECGNAVTGVCRYRISHEQDGNCGYGNQDMCDQLCGAAPDSSSSSSKPAAAAPACSPMQKNYDYPLTSQQPLGMTQIEATIAAADSVGTQGASVAACNKGSSVESPPLCVISPGESQETKAEYSCADSGNGVTKKLLGTTVNCVKAPTYNPQYWYCSGTIHCQSERTCVAKKK